MIGSSKKLNKHKFTKTNRNNNKKVYLYFKNKPNNK